MQLYRVVKGPAGYYILGTMYLLDSTHKLRETFNTPSQLHHITRLASLVTKPHS